VRRRAAVLVVVALSVPLASCRGGDEGPDPYTLEVEGIVEVTGSASRTLRSGEHQLEVGDTVRVTDGTATLALPDEASLELRADERTESVVEVAVTPELIDGDALALGGDDGLELRAGAAVIALDGSARVRRSSGVTLAVYQGRATVDALGQEVVTPALRQLAVSDTGAVPVRPVPLVYDRSNPDPWDVRFLGDAIDMGSQLERRSRALTAQLARPSSDAAFLTSVVPPLRTAAGFTDALLDPARSVGETVVGASIALGGDGAFVGRWRDAFGLRQQGADWGLVALDQRAQRVAVFGVLDGVLDSVTATRAVTSRSGDSTNVGRGTSTSGSGATSTTAPTGGTTTTTTPAGQILPGITVPPLSISPTTTTTVPRSTTTTTSPRSSTPPTTERPHVDDLVDGILDRIFRGLNRPTRRDHPDVPSRDDGRGDGRGRGSAQAVLDGLQRVRPVRGAGVPCPGRVDDRDAARAREGVPGEGRGPRGCATGFEQR
jgi:hypothetical protein